MKKIFLIIFLITSVNFIYCQNQSNLLTIEFKQDTKLKAIEKIESISNYRFFFLDEWLEGKLINGNYFEKNINYILTDIFSDTDINFYIDNEKIILSQNRMIHPQPIFKDFEKANNYNNNQKKLINIDTNNSNLTFIGKETIDDLSDTYIISGIIKNKKNNNPIADVNLKVKNTNISTISDNDGIYNLKLPYGENVIEISGINYQKITQKIIVYNSGKLDFELNEKINVLNEIIVKGKRKQNSRTAITGVTTIEAEGIKNTPMVLGERDVLKIALTLPGIKTAGEGSGGFNVRGGKEDQNLFLLDNGTIYNPAHFFGFFSAINPFTTSKVEIYKGGIPSYYGGRLSSVFDISTKNADYVKLTGEGGIGPVTSNLTISTPILKGKSSLTLGGRATYSEWILKSLKDKQLKNSEASFYDIITKYVHKFNTNNILESTLYFSKDKYSISSDSLYHYSNGLLSMKWKHNFNEKHKSELGFHLSEYKFGIDYNSEINVKGFNFDYKIQESNIGIKLNYNLSENQKLTYGFSSKLYNINPGTFIPLYEESKLKKINLQKEKGLESAVFLTDNYKISKKIIIDVGIRYSIFMPLGSSIQKIYRADLPLNENNQIGERTFKKNEIIKTFNGLEPRVAMKYNFDDSFSIRAGYDKTFQYLHLLSNNTTQSPTDIWKISNMNIRPQSGEQISFGIFKTLNNEDFEVSVEGYYKKSKNVIDYKVGANLLLNENLETELLQGKGKSYGLEILFKKQSGKLNGWIGYTYSRAFLKLDSEFNEETVNKGEYFPANFDKPHDFSAVLNYKITKRFSFSSNFVYQTGRPITYPIGRYTYGNSEYTLFSDRNKFRIPDYYRLDIGFNIEGNHKIKKLAHSFWNISVYNVLGRNNPYAVYFVTENGKVKGYKTSIFGIPVPTLTYNFKF